MKKFLFILSIFFSTFLLSHNVFASEVPDFVLSRYYHTSSIDYLTQYVNDVNNNNSQLYDILDFYNTNYSDTYSYYILYFEPFVNTLSYYIVAFSSPLQINLKSYFTNEDGGYFDIRLMLDNGIVIHPSGNSYSVGTTSPSNLIFLYETTINHSPIVSSNFDLTINSFSTIENVPIDSSITFPPLQPTDNYPFIQMFSVGVGDIFPTFKSLIEGTYVPSVSYREFNLNDYAYIALSLKNYNQTDSFNTTFMVKGNFCPTTVYNYGMQERPSGSTQVCSPRYELFTPTYFDVLKSDIDNHAIYYLKAFDTSIENKVKIDMNIFDVTPITSENANNPSVIINGRSYPTIPYNNLSSTTTENTESGYIPGESKNVFDVSSDSNFIEGLFSNPLQTLGNVWTSIITMFALVGSFIGLLPTTLQYFLYTGFSLGIVLGIIKILL